jgi:GDP-4-dehydro-6-deoxy-D-mannose reductase
VTRPILVTGASGFAGSHLLDALARSGAPLAAWHRPGEAPYAGVGGVAWTAVDVRVAAAVEAALADSRPARIVHCAGLPHVAESWQRNVAALEVNALGTHHLLAAVRRLGLDARVVVPSSALVYRPSAAALGEDAPIGPTSPYALSKLAQERIALAGAAEGQAVIVARPFNHVGPRQEPSFATSSFARQIARAEAGLTPPVLEVGDLGAQRDFSDVRDVARAYVRLADAGEPGRVYNICTGEATSVRTILDRLLALARVRLEVRQDASRLRPADHPVLVGDGSRIRRELGWAPERRLDESLRDLLEHWRAAVAGEAGSDAV